MRSGTTPGVAPGTRGSEVVGGPLSVTNWLTGPPDRVAVAQLLSQVIDPELGVNIVDLGLVYDVAIGEGCTQVRMTLTTPGCPLGAYLDDAVNDALAGLPGIDEVSVRIVWDPAWSPSMMSEAAKGQLGWRR